MRRGSVSPTRFILKERCDLKRLAMRELAQIGPRVSTAQPVEPATFSCLRVSPTGSSSLPRGERDFAAPKSARASFEAKLLPNPWRLAEPLVKSNSYSDYESGNCYLLVTRSECTEDLEMENLFMRNVFVRMIA